MAETTKVSGDRHCMLIERPIFKGKEIKQLLEGAIDLFERAQKNITVPLSFSLLLQESNMVGRYYRELIEPIVNEKPVLGILEISILPLILARVFSRRSSAKDITNFMARLQARIQERLESGSSKGDIQNFSSFTQLAILQTIVNAYICETITFDQVINLLAKLFGVIGRITIEHTDRSLMEFYPALLFSTATKLGIMIGHLEGDDITEIHSMLTVWSRKLWKSSALTSSMRATSHLVIYASCIEALTIGNIDTNYVLTTLKSLLEIDRNTSVFPRDLLALLWVTVELLENNADIRLIYNDTYVSFPSNHRINDLRSEIKAALRALYTCSNKCSVSRIKFINTKKGFYDIIDAIVGSYDVLLSHVFMEPKISNVEIVYYPRSRIERGILHRIGPMGFKVIGDIIREINILIDSHGLQFVDFIRNAINNRIYERAPTFLWYGKVLGFVDNEFIVDFIVGLLSKPIESALELLSNLVYPLLYL